MKYAQVAVDSPRCHQPLTYAIPESIAAAPGHGVWVPFGIHILDGIVLEVSDHTDFEPVRDILALSHPQPLIGQEQMELGCWLSQHYYAPPFSALSLLLPPGWQQRPISYLEAIGQSEVAEEKEFLDWLRDKGRVEQEIAKRRWGMKRSRELISRCLSQGLVRQSYEVEEAKVKPRLVTAVGLQIDKKSAAEMAREKPRYAALLSLLAESGILPLRQVKGVASPWLLRSLEDRGVITKLKQEAKLSYPAPPPLPLLAPLAQEGLLAEAKENLNLAIQGKKPQKQAFLLMGEGRQPFYFHLLAQAVSSGRLCLMLSPEGDSSLHRACAQAFPGRCLGFHHRLSPRQRFDAWQAIKDGAYPIILGSRHALFTPLQGLSLIIIDEEQEPGYKETNTPPFYHAREVALKLSALRGAVVVLGSATPEVESYYRCEQGKLSLLRLPEEPGRGKIEVVNLRQELRQGQRGPLSRALTQGLSQTLAQGGQALLFINRRGLATSVHCEACAEPLRCPRCELPLTHHREEAGLICHLCGHREPLPLFCLQCGRGRLRLRGLGTEKVEEEVRRLFPQARLGRGEEGTGKRRNQLLEQWRQHQLDILIGTQALAQGPESPQADLVGVIAGDMSLSSPDFRCGERTFQLLVKLLKLRRPGGLGIVQAYLSEHYAIRAVAEFDYSAFYHTEIGHRRRYGYPPFNRLARLLVLHANMGRGEQLAQELASHLTEKQEGLGLSLRLLGPALAFPPRLRGRYRWQLLLLGEGGEDIERLLSLTPIPPGVRVEPDPVEL